MQKILIGVITLCFLLASCASSDQMKKEYEPITFSILYNQDENALFSEDWLVIREYKNRKNVTFDIIIGDNASYMEAVDEIFLSGNIPDVILKVWPDNIEKYAMDGLLLPISDYVDKMPYFNAYVEKNNLSMEIDKLKLSNGKYYVLPGYTREIQTQQWIYRKDLFDKHGLDEPKSYDELLAALIVLKEAYPDSSPLTACWGGAHLFAMMGAGYDITAGWNGTQSYNEITKEWEYSPATDNYKEMLIFLNKCYEAGVFDPTIYTQSDQEYYDKLLKGDSFVTVSWVSSGFDNWNNELNNNGIEGGVWEPLKVPLSTIGIQKLPAINQYKKGLVISASVVSEPYFDRLIEFLDWAIYSDEGRLLTTWGVEGITYIEREQGKSYLPHIITPKNIDGITEPTEGYGLDTFYNLCENEEFEDYKKPSSISSFLNESLLNNETAPMDPTLVLNSNEADVVVMLSEKLNLYVDTMSKKFITGEKDIDLEWEDYIKNLSNIGYIIVEEIWNNAWLEH